MEIKKKNIIINIISIIITLAILLAVFWKEILQVPLIVSSIQIVDYIYIILLAIDIYIIFKYIKLFANIWYIYQFCFLNDHQLLTDYIASGYWFHLLMNESNALWADFNDDTPCTLLIDCVYFYILLKEHI